MDALTRAKIHRHTGALSDIANEVQGGASPQQMAHAFVELGKALMLSEQSQAHHAVFDFNNPVVKGRLEKAAADPYTTTDTSLWGTGPLGELAENYLATEAEHSLVEALIAGGAKKLPVNVGRAIVATGVSADIVGEGLPKPVVTGGLSREDATKKKPAGIVIKTDELVREIGTETFKRELKKAVEEMSNVSVMGLVIDSNVQTATTLGQALGMAGASESYVVAMHPSEVADLAVANAAGGTLGVRGGMLCPGVMIIAVDSATVPVVIPTNAVAIRDYGLSMRPAAHATIEMDTSPVGGESAVMTSLWQNNLRGLIVEREFEMAVDTSRVTLVQDY